MGRRGPSDQEFASILEGGAQVDDIFRDSPAPRGSNPFEPTTNAENTSDDATKVTPLIAPLAVEEANDKGAAEVGGVELSSVAVIDNDSLFCINRKFAAIEALFRLTTREHYSFGQLISEILRIALEQVKSEAGSFLEIDHQNKCMFFRAVAGRSSQNLLNFTVPVGQGIAGFVCETQQPMALSSVDDSSVYLKSISDSVGFETKNLVAYPIVIRGVTFGCIELLNRLGEPQFTDADKEVMVAIAEYAGKVIENRLLMSAMSKELAALKKKKADGGVAA